LAAQWLKLPFGEAGEALCPALRDFAVVDRLVLPCLPADREIAKFLQL